MNDPNPFDPEALDEFAVYEVNVQHEPNNVEHGAILLTGFKSGSYARVFSASYERPHDPADLHSVRVGRKLTDMPEGPLDTFDLQGNQTQGNQTAEEPPANEGASGV